MKRILITGGSGFVASHLAPYLAERGHEIIAVSRNRDLAFANARITTAATPQSSAAWAPLLQGVDAVIHLAGLAHGVFSDAQHDDINRRLASDIAEAAHRARISHFVFVSSIAAQSGPAADHVLTESDPPQPEGAYGAAKRAAERAIAQSGVIFTILRPVVIDGPGAKGNAATLNALARIPLPLPFGALQNRRSMLSIANFNSAIETVLFNDAAFGEIFIVADPDALTVPEIIARVRRRAGRRPRLFGLSPGLLQLGLKLVGKGALWQRLGRPLVASPAKLMAIGWQPEQG